MRDVLLAMTEDDFHAKLVVKVLCHALSTIDTSMLTTGTAERYHETRELTFDKSLRMEIDNWIDMLEETENLAVLLQEVDDGLIEPCQMLVLDVASGIVRSATIEHIASSVTANIRDCWSFTNISATSFRYGYSFTTPLRTSQSRFLMA